jgi:hypothetical protein
MEMSAFCSIFWQILCLRSFLFVGRVRLRGYARLLLESDSSELQNTSPWSMGGQPGLVEQRWMWGKPYLLSLLKGELCNCSFWIPDWCCFWMFAESQGCWRFTLCSKKVWISEQSATILGLGQLLKACCGGYFSLVTKGWDCYVAGELPHGFNSLSWIDGVQVL